MTLQFSCGAAIASHGSLSPHVAGATCRTVPPAGTARPGSICKPAAVGPGSRSRARARRGAGQRQAPEMPSSIWQMDSLPGSEQEVPVVGQAGRVCTG